MKKIWYIPLLLILLCLLGSVIYSNKQLQSPVPENEANIIADNTAPAAVSPEENGKAAPVPSSATDVFNASTGDDRAAASTPVSSAKADEEAASTPAEPQGSRAITVNIAVVGKDGELLFGPGRVDIPESSRQEATALEALAATGLPYQVAKRYPDFVESIAGLSNKGQAGWLYQVNGEVPLMAASKKPVVADDYVIWWYSNSINEPPPKWEQLSTS